MIPNEKCWYPIHKKKNGAYLPNVLKFLSGAVENVPNFCILTFQGSRVGRKRYKRLEDISRWKWNQTYYNSKIFFFRNNQNTWNLLQEAEDCSQIRLLYIAICSLRFQYCSIHEKNWSSPHLTDTASTAVFWLTISQIRTPQHWKLTSSIAYLTQPSPVGFIKSATAEVM